MLAEASLRQTPLFDQSQSYWYDRIRSLPPAPDLPLALNPSSISKPTFTRHTSFLDADSWALLKSRAASTGLTQSALLLAAFAEVLSLWSNSARFTLNLTLFNRLPLHPQVNDLVGDFTSLTLLEIDNRPVASRAEGEGSGAADR